MTTGTGRRLTDGVASTLAAELFDAREAVRTVPQLSLRHPEMSIEDAYAVQRAWLEIMRGRGRSVVGRKVGLTSMPMQRSMGIDEPDFGLITDDMLFADGADIPTTLFSFPRVEVELAFVLSADLSGRVSIQDVLDATEYIAPAIEILDSRIEMTDPVSGHRRTIVDTVSDNAADAGMVLGTARLDPDDLRPREISAVLEINDVIEETGVAVAVLGNPAAGVAWLAGKLGEYGESLRAGEVILSGSLIQSIPVRAGDVVRGEFGSLGEVTCRFV